jgi:phage baseplate assembly protein W
MAIIRLDNLTKPRQVNLDRKEYDKSLFPDDKAIYTDLHLDLKLKTITNGDISIDAGDIDVDENVNAIRNSIKNIFTTKKGQKIYDPEFGASLEQHLFEKVDDFYAKLIGKEILYNIEAYEPRIDVLKILVLPIPDQNEYNISIYYTFLKLKKEQTLKLKILNNGEIIF